MENFFSFPDKKEANEEKKDEDNYKKLVNKLSEIELNRNNRYVASSVVNSSKNKEDSYKFSYLAEKKKSEMTEEVE